MNAAQAFALGFDKVTPRNLGTKIERAVKPIAIALKLPCLDENHKLKPDSPCAKRRDFLNNLTKPKP